ncbi:LPXTG cell wall anchor domain-containing protein [Streptococcus plurextorum]
MSESVSESVSESISESISESVSESVSESISESTSNSQYHADSDTPDNPTATGAAGILPNTGESESRGLLAGLGLLFGTALFAKKRKKETEKVTEENVIAKDLD